MSLQNGSALKARRCRAAGPAWGIVQGMSARDDAIERSYDRVPYHSRAIDFTHPSRLCALARLVGLDAPDVDRCRVLELGCASGGNLVPMAAQLPEARFLGIDLSAVQIDAGREIVGELGLTNVELRHMSVTDVTRQLGEFDYILAHGLYSWVPADVRDKVLGVFAENLAPAGVAFLSFNIYPGRSPQMAVRELMMADPAIAAAGEADWRPRVAGARRILAALGECLAAQETPFAQLLKAELKGFAEHEDTFLLHDTLSPINEPVYFHQFMSKAESHGLQYVWEAIPSTTALEQFPPQVRQVLRRTCRSVVELEQWVDVLRRRALRKTILCRQDAKLDRTVRPERVRRLFVASPAQVERPGAAGATGGTAGTVEYSSPYVDRASITDVFVNGLMARLMGAWPRSVAVEEIIAHESDAAAERVCATLAQLLLIGLVEFDAYPPACAIAVSDRPVASPVARLQARRGTEVAHLRHGTVTLTPLHREVLMQLDGSRGRREIVEHLVQVAADGRLGVDVTRLAAQGGLRAALEQALESVLKGLADGALLVA
jgi:2-polyprenyl-3-methyl-5-hydroxy-6-metoxy-1,4-benzoquinol methylase